MPELRRLLIADEPTAWARAGFAVAGPADGDGPGAGADGSLGSTSIGTVAVTFVDPAGGEGGVVGIELAPDHSDPDPDDSEPDEGGSGTTGSGPIATSGSLDGITWTAVADPPAPLAEHPNRVVRLDHLVINTPDLARTTTALERAGFEVRRTRDVPGSEPARRQVFLWAGEPILEVVGLVEPEGRPDDRGPAVVWGLACTCDDLDRAVAEVGPALSPPKDAVQPGRRITTVDTRSLGIRTSLALMSAHVRPSEADRSGNRTTPDPGDG